MKLLRLMRNIVTIERNTNKSRSNRLGFFFYIFTTTSKTIWNSNILLLSLYEHACSILQDLAVWKRKNGIDNDEKKKLTAYFKLAYKLYLNLNASSKEVAEHVSKNRSLAEVEAFCKCYLSIQSGYRISSINLSSMDSTVLRSILEGAQAKGKQMIQEANKVSKKKDKTALPPSKSTTEDGKQG